MTASEARRAGGVLDAVERDVEVAARGGLVERRIRDLHELCRPAELVRDQLGDFDVETHHALGILRVRFDVRRAAFGVAAPFERRRRLRVDLSGRERDADEDYAGAQDQSRPAR